MQQRKDDVWFEMLSLVKSLFYDLSIQTKLQTEWFVWEGEKLIHLKLSSDFGDEEIK